MLTVVAYISGILGSIASLLEILQFLKILDLKRKLIWFITVIICSTVCFSIYYVIDSRNEQIRIDKIKSDLIENDAKSIANGIVISGFEESGEYLGYLTQITGFYYRHIELYGTEYSSYSKSLENWSNFFRHSREDGRFYQGYSSELSELKGLVVSGRDHLNQIARQKINQ